MIKTNYLRRRAVRLLCLVAAILALSQTAGAWNYYLRGDTPGWTTDNSSYKFSTTDNQVYTLKLASLEGDFKIHNGDDNRDNWFSANSSSATELKNNSSNQLFNTSEDGSHMSLPANAKDITFTLYDNGGYNGTANDGYPETLTVSFTVGSTPGTTTYYLRGDFDKTNNAWNAGLTFSGNPLTCKQTWTDTGWGFKVTDGTTWYGDGTTIQKDGTGDVTLTGDVMKLASDAKDKEVTFTLTLGSDGKPSTLTPTWDNGGGGGSDDPVLTKKVQLSIFTTQSWIKGDGFFDFGNGYYGNTFTASDNTEIRFRVKIDGVEYIAEWGKDNNEATGVALQPEDHSTWNEAKCINPQGHQKDNYWTFTPESGKKYTIMVNNSGSEPYVYYIEGEYVPPVPERTSLPVYPKGVKSEDELAAFTGWPVYYLQGKELNYNRVTPEYQMEKEADGTYSLVVTLRNTEISVKRFDDAENDGVTLAQQNFGGITPTGEEQYLTKGRRYKVIYDPTADTLTFEDMGVEMPFISMIGEKWSQHVKERTPYQHGERYTDYGWQDAWIQYDSEENVAKTRPNGDTPGAVMYNTMWPPRYPITFKSAFTIGDETYDFPLDSRQLSFEPGETKTGKEWKAEFKAKGKNTTDLDISTIGEKNEYENALALKDDVKYTIYRTSDMWINGDVKLWTGWGGECVGSGRYDNKWFANWGHFKASDKTTAITPESTVPLFNEKGDVAFAQPTYYKHVYFFYDNTDPQGKGKSVLFTELATGGAEIAAMNVAKEGTAYKAGYENGMYRPRLTSTVNIKDKKITKVVITPWKSDGSASYPAVFTYNGDKDYTATTFSDMFADLEGMEGNNGNRWTFDETMYSNGNYRYKMVVEIEGVSEPIEVESNPFTIFRGDATPRLRAFQLVKVIDPEVYTAEVKSSNKMYYYTFSDNIDRDVFLLETTVENPNYDFTETQNIENGTYEGIENEDALVGYDINPTFVAGHPANWLQPTKSIEEVKKELFYGVGGTSEARVNKGSYGDPEKYRFSAKVVLVGDVQGNELKGLSIDTPVKADFKGKYVKKDNDPTLLSNSDGPQVYFTVEPTISTEGGADDPDYGFRYSFTWTPKFTYTFTDADGNTQNIKKTDLSASVSGSLVLPEPRLVEDESRLELIYGDDGTEAKKDALNDRFQYTFHNKADYTLPLGEARFQQVRKRIVIERPNVTLRYRALAKQYIQERANALGIETEYTDATKAPLVVGLFKFYTYNKGDETQRTPVVINNGVYAPNNGGLDWYIYHSATKRPADMYFKANSETDYTGSVVENITGFDFQNAYPGQIITCEKRETYPTAVYYPRWEDGLIAGLRIDQNAPQNRESDATVDVTDQKYLGKDADNQSNTHIGIVNYAAGYLKQNDKEANPADWSHLFEQATLKVYMGSQVQNRAKRVDASGEEISGKEMQYSADNAGDYFLIRVIDRVSNAELVEPMTVSARQLAEQGVEIPVEKDYGHWYAEQFDDFTATVNKGKHLPGVMEVRISHLYPFLYDMKANDTPSTVQKAPRRKAEGETVSSDFNSGNEQDTKTDVIKSDAASYTFGNDIVTSVEGIEAVMRDLVVAGQGFIEVHGEGVEIYGADGICVATGEGRHEVGAGVYVVRLNGRAEKVIVR